MNINPRQAVKELLSKEIGDDVHFSVEIPEVKGRGDYSTNIALARAKVEGKNPMDMAKEWSKELADKHPEIFSEVVPLEPGFINMHLAPKYIWKQVEGFRKRKKAKRKGRASVEFISANPTGPLHIGNARSGPIGDTISNVLMEDGYKVKREYLHNDAGAQIDRFGESLWHWYQVAINKPSELPEHGYEGEYVKEIGREAEEKFGKELKGKKGQKVVTEMALAKFEKENFDVMRHMGVEFDLVTKESKLVKTKTKKAIEDLREKGLLEEKEGATWFVPKDEHLKDRETVVIKGDGTYLYFANDIAYHREKFKKNDFVIDILGENHEGHVPKLKAVANAFGFDESKFEVLIYGQVTVKDGDKVISMSKRKGNFVTAEEVLEEVGVDAFRYFMLQYAPRSGMKFDLELAKQQSKVNPVYYIQYAHARACSILAKAETETPAKPKWKVLGTTHELELIKKLIRYPEMMEEIAHSFQVQHLAKYAHDLAHAFTRFYESTKVIGADGELEANRIALVTLTRDTIAHLLSLMGISAPEHM
ncbi:MAG: arginine--tRNA ligase [bacterium]|nr:arginine--tRNA ligase [bacterium]